MNGFPRNLLATTPTYSSKKRKRSLEDQSFDKVFFGAPYDDEEEEESTVVFCNNKPLGQSWPTTPPGI